MLQVNGQIQEGNTLNVLFTSASAAFGEYQFHVVSFHPYDELSFSHTQQSQVLKIKNAAKCSEEIATCPSDDCVAYCTRDEEPSFHSLLSWNIAIGTTILTSMRGACEIPSSTECWIALS